MTPNLHKHLWSIAALIAAALIVAAYINSHGNVIRAEQVKSDVQKQISVMKDDLRAQLESIRAQKESTKTPEQIVRVIPQYVQLPSAPVVTSPPDVKPVAASETQNPLPNAPSAGVYFPPEDVKPLFDKLADAKACDLKLNECTKENGLLETRAKAAEKAMHGGGFWSKLKSNSKWFVIGGGAAAGLLCGTGHCK